MSTVAIPRSRPIIYTDSDGKPMAENTLQYQWIVTITGGLRHLFADDPNVIIAGDLFWYPVEGHPEIRTAPDTMVVFGRPQGHRGSYRQWEEGAIAPQVLFEILSSGNRFGEMSAQFAFYQRYGVEEYYIFDPEPQRLELSGFVRNAQELVEVANMNGHVSPRLKIKFEMGEDGLRILRPDGQPFVTFEELARDRDEQRFRAEQERLRAEQERLRAEQERQHAQRERERADQLQAELERLRREGRQ